MSAQNADTPDWAEYYDRHGILGELVGEEPELSLADDLREAIRGGKRKRRLKSVTLKLDPLQVRAIRKLATMKGIPYQTLIRYWLTEDIKAEMNLIAGR